MDLQILGKFSLHCAFTIGKGGSGEEHPNACGIKVGIKKCKWVVRVLCISFLANSLFQGDNLMVSMEDGSKCLRYMEDDILIIEMETPTQVFDQGVPDISDRKPSNAISSELTDNPIVTSAFLLRHNISLGIIMCRTII